MKTTKYLFAVCIGLFFLGQSACERELNEINSQSQADLGGNPAQTPVGVIFSDLKMAGKSGIRSIQLADAETGSWNLRLQFDDFLSESFTAVDENGNLIPGAGKDDFLTLSGELDGQPNSSVRLVISNRWMEGIIHKGGETYQVQSRFTDHALADGNYAVRLAQQPAEPGFVCGVEEVGAETEASAENREEDPDESLPESANCWKLAFKAHGDYEYFAATANGDANLATFGIIVNMYHASNYFQTINLDFELGQIVIFQSQSNPFYYPTSSNTVGLLEQLRDFCNFFLGSPNPDHDGVLLFTGKRTYDAAGRAYRGSVCNYWGLYSYGIVCTRYTTGVPMNLSTVINITGHEVGHMLGAQHTEDIPASSPCRSVQIYTDDLMWMGSNPSPTMGFHECARRQMNRHIWYHHDCLAYASCD